MRILIVANGSFPIKDLLLFSKQFIRCASNPPTLLTILNPGDDRPPCQNNTRENQARKILGDHCLRTKTRIGQSVEEVICEIQDGGYDLVIVGDRQNHLVTRFFRTSTAIRIAEVAPCPVIVVKGKAGPIRRILMCDSGSKASHLLSRFTSQLADLLPSEGEVTVLHVMSQISAGPGVRGRQLRAEAKKLIEEDTPEGRLLEKDTQILERSSVHPVPKVRHGLVVDEIMAEASNGNYDLVVIGAYISEGWGRFLLDDMAHKILTQMDLPVLVVR
jgi:nucleotide-binding universal stress UspA family protein